MSKLNIEIKGFHLDDELRKDLIARLRAFQAGQRESVKILTKIEFDGKEYSCSIETELARKKVKVATSYSSWESALTHALNLVKKKLPPIHSTQFYSRP